MDPYSRDIRLIDAVPSSIVTDYVIGITVGATGLTNSWPATAVGLALETTASFGGGLPWSTAPQPPSLENGHYHLIIQPAAAAAFYRLRR